MSHRRTGYVVIAVSNDGSLYTTTCSVYTVKQAINEAFQQYAELGHAEDAMRILFVGKGRIGENELPEFLKDEGYVGVEHEAADVRF